MVHALLLHATAMSVPCMQIDRRGDQCECMVVGYDRCRGMHKVQWTSEASHDARGRGQIKEDWVDFAEDIVYREIVRKQVENKDD
jgi:hypothetical protein